jgi:hypothetical protein
MAAVNGELHSRGKDKETSKDYKNISEFDEIRNGFLLLQPGN